MTRRIKDPGSALTHFIAMIGAAAASVPLLMKASTSPRSLFLLPAWFFYMLRAPCITRSISLRKPISSCASWII